MTMRGRESGFLVTVMMGIMVMLQPRAREVPTVMMGIMVILQPRAREVPKGIDRKKKKTKKITQPVQA